MEKTENILFEDSAGLHWVARVDPALSGNENMACDALSLEHASTDMNFLPTLRFFLWKNPTISIGYAQPIDDIDEQRALADGIAIVRRPTGGRAIYHDGEFTYSVTLPAWHHLAKQSVLETYNRISMALAAGFVSLGINVTLSRGNIGLGTTNPSCFSSTSRYELAIDGKKLVGSAQRRKNGAVLQQGSIMVTNSFYKIADYLKCDNKLIINDLTVHSTYLAAQIEKVPSYSEFCNSMILNFKTTIF